MTLMSDPPDWRYLGGSLMALFIVLLGSLPFVAPWHNPPWFTYYPEWLSAVLTLALAGLLIGSPRPQGIAGASWWFGSFALAIVVQTAIVQPGYWMPGLTAAAQLAVCAVLTQTIMLARARWGTEAVVFALCLGLVAGGLLSGLISWTQRLDMTRHFPGLVLVHPIDPRQALGNIGQRNLYGHYMMWASMAAVYLFARRPGWRIALFALMSWMAFEAALAESRTTLAYYAMWLLVALASLFWHSNAVQKRFALASFWAIGLGLLMQFIGPDIVSALASALGEPIQARAGMDRFADQGAGLGRRVAEWQKAWMTFREHPLLGSGWGYFAGASYRLHGLPEFSGFREDVLWTHCHNSVLQILAEMGLLGAGFLIGLLVLLLRALRQWQSGVSMLALPLLGVSLLHSQMEYPLWYLHYLAMFAIFLVLLEPEPALQAAAPRRNWRLPALVLASALALLHPLMYEWSVGGLQGKPWVGQGREGRLQDLRQISHLPLFDYLAETNMARQAIYDEDSWPAYDGITERLLNYRPFPDANFWRMCVLGHTGRVDQIRPLFEQAQIAYPGYAYGFARDMVRYHCLPPSIDPYAWLEPELRR